MQSVDELSAKLSTVAKEEHIPLRQYMFALAIKSISRISFGDYFKDDQKILELNRNYDIVSLIFLSKHVLNTPFTRSKNDLDRDLDYNVDRDP